jgi:hypothetical protein
MGTQPVRQLVREDPGEEGVEIEVLPVRRGEQDFEIGTSVFWNLACWMFRSRIRLLPFCWTTRSSLGRL